MHEEDKTYENENRAEITQLKNIIDSKEAEIRLKTGDILMFPSNFMYPHEVTECTKGTRYSFVSWAF
jgi:predicted 2-oxoglutarate/Fe(II)-dependent dioxygenase YbiX